jgi:hypothetical protein
LRFRVDREHAEKGDVVNLVGFGNFKVVKRQARTGRNPPGDRSCFPGYSMPRIRASSSWGHAAPARAHGFRPPFPMPMWWITDRAGKRPIRQLFTIVPIHPLAHCPSSVSSIQVFNPPHRLNVSDLSKIPLSGGKVGMPNNQLRFVDNLFERFRFPT